MAKSKKKKLFLHLSFVSFSSFGRATQAKQNKKPKKYIHTHQTDLYKGNIGLAKSLQKKTPKHILSEAKRTQQNFVQLCNNKVNRNQVHVPVLSMLCTAAGFFPFDFLVTFDNHKAATEHKKCIKYYCVIQCSNDGRLNKSGL